MKKGILTFISLLCILKGIAQNGFMGTFDLGFGAHTMKYNVAEGEYSPSFGVEIGGTCSYYFTNNIGVGIGSYLGLYQSKYTLSHEYTSSILYDTDNDYTYQTNLDVSLDEKHKLLMLNIPISFRAKFNFGDDWCFYANEGAMLNIPVYTHYKSSLTQTSTAHYFEPNIDFHDMPNHGFSTESYNQKGDFKLNKLGFSPFVEVGVSRPISTKCSLYLGLYFSYNVTNLLKDNKNDFAYFEPGYVPSSSTAFASNLTNDLKSLSLGMNIGIIFKENIKRVQTYDDSLSVLEEIAQEPDTLLSLPVLDTIPCIDFEEVNNDTLNVVTPHEIEVKKVVKRIDKSKKVRLLCTHGVKTLLVFKESLSEEFSPEVTKKLNNIAKSMVANPTEKVVIFSENTQRSNNIYAVKKEVTFLYKIKKYLVSCGVKSSQIVFSMDGSNK